MEVIFTLELLLLTQTRTKVKTTGSVGGTLVAMTQLCAQDVLTTTVMISKRSMDQGKKKTEKKNMDQGKKTGSMFTQETVWEL